MADKKISALTAASTPLAGTEVLPIVQSGTTVKVAVSDLTAGRAMAALSLTTATVQATNSGGLALKNSGGTTQMLLGGGGGDNITLSVATNITPANAAVTISPTGTGTLTLNPATASTINNMSIGATTALSGRFTDVTATTGNVVIGTSGQGIDFSATPGTGTSELLADYEEGTWTPTLTTNGTNFTSVTYNSLVGGKYTKIGNMVHVNGFMFTDGVTVGAASGVVCIGGLPFTVNTATGGKADANSAMSISRVGLWLLNNPIGIQAIGGSTNLELYYRTTANGDTTSLPVTNVGTGGSSNLMYFAGTYIAA
jgi:hypothetical protein